MVGLPAPSHLRASHDPTAQYLGQFLPNLVPVLVTVGRQPWPETCSPSSLWAAMSTDNKVVASGVATILVLLFVGAFPINAYAQDDRRPPPRPPESLSTPAGLIAEPDVIQRIVIFGERRHASGELNSGLQWGLAEMIPGAGWAGGLVYRRWGKNDRQVAEISSAFSTRGYMTVEARYEMPQLARSRFAVGARGSWQDYPRLTYFGQGSDSLEANESEYGLRSFNVAGYGIYRPVQGLSVRRQLGI